MPALSELADHSAILAALRTCRKAMLDVVRTVRPMGIAYHGVSMVIAAVNAMATVITGELEPFASGGSVGPERAAVVRTRQNEMKPG